MELLADTAPIVIGARGMDEVMQNIRMIVRTFVGSVPLHRDFAHDPALIDSPSPLETARLVGALATAIETWEPRVRVESIRLEQKNGGGAMLGVYVPRITFSLRES